MGKRKVVNNGEIETRFAGKNLTSTGRIKLIHKFAKKLGIKEAGRAYFCLSKAEGDLAIFRVLRGRSILFCPDGVYFALFVQ